MRAVLSTTSCSSICATETLTNCSHIFSDFLCCNFKLLDTVTVICGMDHSTMCLFDPLLHAFSWTNQTTTISSVICGTPKFARRSTALVWNKPHLLDSFFFLQKIEMRPQFARLFAIQHNCNDSATFCPISHQTHTCRRLGRVGWIPKQMPNTCAWQRVRQPNCYKIIVVLLKLSSGARTFVASRVRRDPKRCDRVTIPVRDRKCSERLE